MIDTVAVMLPAVPVNLIGLRAWQRHSQSMDRLTGQLRDKLVLNTAAGLHLTLVGDQQLIAERSLPKALHGSNVRDLRQHEIPRAIDQVQREVHEALGCEVPPLAQWEAVRVDYCQNLQLPDEVTVRQILTKLAGVQLPRKGRPVVGQAGSVTWPGRVSVQWYGKYRESSDPEAFGVLRQEVRVRRQRTFREALRTGANRVLLERAVLGETRELFLKRFEGHYSEVYMSEQEITDRELAQVAIKTLGVRRFALLIGWCCMWALTGSPKLEDLVEPNAKGWSGPTRWRMMQDLRKLRDAVREHRLMQLSEDDRRSIDQVAETLSQLKRYAA